jgi:hypothetical protein
MIQAQVVMAAVNYITILEETIRKMREKNSTVALPMDCMWQPVDLTRDSSDSLSPVPEETQECTVPLTSSPQPMDDQSGATLSDFLDHTLENLVPVISEEELPEMNSLDDLYEWLHIECSSA